ncbi:hypothetical protein K439DRAFT_1648441 [Ramaria rubella]|nr:hypothetical protein K439DRAFT_1648441 [Ramaria rubella]
MATLSTLGLLWTTMARVATAEAYPAAYTLYCLHHLNGNVGDHVCPMLSGQFQAFLQDFWVIYCAVSPEAFDCAWDELLTKYPRTCPYLEEHVYPDREHWAWAWVSQVFTAGIRTNGRVKSENRIHKALGGPKVSLAQLFDRLNARTAKQTIHEQIWVREATQCHHATNLESLFACPLQSYREIGQSLYYHTEALLRPEGIHTWRMTDAFENDHKYVSTKWLISLIVSQGLNIMHLLHVMHMGMGMAHIIALLESGLYVCDCCMGSNLGIPCRHLFNVLTTVKTLPFHIGLIHRRYIERLI